jgi:hypothetical protein
MLVPALLSEDGSLHLEVSVHDANGVRWMTVPVQLGPYFDPADSPELKRNAERLVVSDSDCLAAIAAAARKAAPSHMVIEWV